MPPGGRRATISATGDGEGRGSLPPRRRLGDALAAQGAGHLDHQARSQPMTPRPRLANSTRMMRSGRMGRQLERGIFGDCAQAGFLILHRCMAALVRLAPPVRARRPVGRAPHLHAGCKRSSVTISCVLALTLPHILSIFSTRRVPVNQYLSGADPATSSPRITMRWRSSAILRWSETAASAAPPPQVAWLRRRFQAVHGAAPPPPDQKRLQPAP